MRAEPLFYLASPNDVVLGKPRDCDDHVAWLLEKEQFEDALNCALQWKEQLQWISVQQVGKKLLRDLIARKEYEKVCSSPARMTIWLTGWLQACNWLHPILGERDAEQWADWIFVFAQHRQIETVVSEAFSVAHSL